jgi:beta-glucosidase
MKAGGGRATLSADGSFKEKPDAAIVVFGERPYAEMRGDIRTLEFQPGDKEALKALRALKAAGVPVVSIFLSGRPMWVNPEINASDAFVAAWLPGSEGGGIADVIIGGPGGKPRKDFTGRLSYSWPKTAGQFTLNKGQPGYDPLFAFGYGLSYAHPGKVGRLGEISGVDPGLANTSIFFAKGSVPAPFSWVADDKVARAPIDGPATQEGAVKLTWPEGEKATLGIHGADLDLTRETNADLVLLMTYRVERAPAGTVRLGFGTGAVDATPLFGAGSGWRTTRISLKCLRDRGADMAKVSTQWSITTMGPFSVSIADLKLATDSQGAVCPAPGDRQ